MPNNWTITDIRDSDVYRAGQLPIRGVEAQFMVGNFGPFRVQVEKTDDWAEKLRGKVDEEAQRVQALQA